MNKKLKSFALASIILLSLTTISLGKAKELSQSDPINPRPEIISELCLLDPINPKGAISPPLKISAIEIAAPNHKVKNDKLLNFTSISFILNPPLL